MRAGSAVELAGLEALVRSASFLELAGSRLGRPLPGPLPGSVDVLLERPLLDDVEEAQLTPADEVLPECVWILTEAEFEPGLAALRGGRVRALLPARASADEIRSAIQAAAAGLVVLHPDIASQLSFSPLGPGAAGNDALSAPGQQLSPREAEVLNLLAAGLGNKQIAGRLGISEHTVKFHVASIFNKLGASSRAEAVAHGVRRGFIVL